MVTEMRRRLFTPRPPPYEPSAPVEGFEYLSALRGPSLERVPLREGPPLYVSNAGMPPDFGRALDGLILRSAIDARLYGRLSILVAETDHGLIVSNGGVECRPFDKWERPNGAEDSKEQPSGQDVSSPEGV